MINDENKRKSYELEMLYKQYNNYGYIIPELKLSAPLYRYRSNLEYAIDEIENEYIYLSPIEELNDPFDSSCKFTYEESMLEIKPAIYFWERCYFLRHHTWYDELNKILLESNIGKKEMSMKDFFLFLEKQVSKKEDRIYAIPTSRLYYSSTVSTVHRRLYGNVACFSELSDSIIMWSYYANSHKGICLKYEPQILDESNPEYKSIKNSIRKVWYSSTRYDDKEGMFSPFVKSEVWSHEKEWRIFRKCLENTKIFFPCLTAVYLGLNFDYRDDNLAKIIKIISNKKRNIDLYFYTPSKTEFSLRKIKIDYKNNYN